MTFPILNHAVENYLNEPPLERKTFAQKVTRLLSASTSNPFLLISKLVAASPLKFLLNDRSYIRLMYRAETGRKLNLKNPERFNEKIQALKLNKEAFGYWVFADKYEVRKHVATIIGVKYLIPLIKIYDYVEEIDFNELPNQFVLKCTHDSGTIIICRDKAHLNQDSVLKILQSGLNRNYFYEHREPQYKNIKPRILCQEFISTPGGDVPSDYKIFCFDGVPTYIEVDTDRFEKHGRVIYDVNWNRAPFSIKFVNPDLSAPKPDNLDEMLQVSTKLANRFKFVRVDLFSINNRIYFCELTFHHGAGYEQFYPDEYDLRLGEMLDLKSK